MIWVGGLGLYLFFKSTPVLPSTGTPTEYWIDPTTNQLWYESGGVLVSPVAGGRPASSYEITKYWPPVNHPEFAQFAAGTAPGTPSGFYF